MTRREFIGSTALPLAAAASSADGAASVRYLFIDREYIQDARGISLRVNPPRKAGPVMTGDRPWETGTIGSYFSVLEHDDVYKMWYMAFAGKGEGRMCYATSSDGVKWERPGLGLVEFEGSRANNIVIERFREGAVMLDPVAPPEQRFKTLVSFGGNRPSLLGVNRTGTLTLATSPDGLRWTAEYPVLPFHPDSQNNLFWDARIGKYAAYLRGWNPLRVAVRAEIPREDILKPWPYTASANPKYLWRAIKGGDVWPPAISTELPTVLAADDNDPDCDLYTPNVQPYGDAYLAFPSLFRHTAPAGSERIPMAGVLDVHMAVSRDGVHFDRPERRPYIPRGIKGEIDSANAYMALGMLQRGSLIYQYYAGSTADHVATEPGRSALMLAVQRLDGFVSAEADYRGGEFTTPPVPCSGDRLLLNLDTSATGTARVEIVGAPGFELASCDRIITNDIAHEVKWKGKASLAALRGQPVRLRFALTNARLFSFQFV